MRAFETKFNVPVVETYGLTEAASQVTANPVPPGKRKPGSAGLPVGVSLRVCKPGRGDSRLEDVPQGEAGEICVREPSVVSGYYANAGSSAFQEGWFRWTRYIFLFITAFVLTYVYFGRPFDTRRFWIKRGIGVLLPYCLWSIAYTWSGNNVPHDPVGFARVALFDIVTIQASFQLYYILLTLEFYLILPFFLAFLRLVARHPWWTLAVSFVLELALTYVSYQYIQQGPIASSSMGQLISDIQDRFLLTYQFYVILGGLAALHWERLRAFLLAHSRFVVGIFALGLVSALAVYGLEALVYHATPAVASAPVQLIIVVYSLAVILFFTWLGCAWAARRGPNGLPSAYRFWNTLSDASFGIYLVQAFILTFVLVQVLPQMPPAWPSTLRVLLAFVLTAGGSIVFSVVVLYVPILSRLVGRPSRWPKQAARPRESLGGRLAGPGKAEP